MGVVHAHKVTVWTEWVYRLLVRIRESVFSVLGSDFALINAVCKAVMLLGAPCDGQHKDGIRHLTLSLLSP